MAQGPASPSAQRIPGPQGGNGDSFCSCFLYCVQVTCLATCSPQYYLLEGWVNSSALTLVRAVQGRGCPSKGLEYGESRGQRPPPSLTMEESPPIWRRGEGGLPSRGLSDSEFWGTEGPSQTIPEAAHTCISVEGLKVLTRLCCVTQLPYSPLTWDPD